MEALQGIEIHRVFIDPQALHELRAVAGPHRIEHRLVQMGKPIVVPHRHAPACRMPVTPNSASTSDTWPCRLSLVLTAPGS